jgi:hypothetical protein
MSKFDTKDKIDRFLYRTYNILSDLLFHLNPSVKLALEHNRLFKDKHKGERCFIFGTGPSLKSLTTSQIEILRNEIVFGVNFFYKVEELESVVPTYYTLVDDLFRGRFTQTFSDVVYKYKDKPPAFVTDLRVKHLVEQVSPKVPHIFIYARKYPVDRVSEKLDDNLFATMNVISQSIVTAIYMGFKEIYLIGCDYNIFCTAGKGRVEHAYDKVNEKHTMIYNLGDYLKFYWLITEVHYLIEKLGQEKNVKIINATPDSLLDAYPRVSIAEALPGSLSSRAISQEENS